MLVIITELLAPVLLTIFNTRNDLSYYPSAMKIGQVAPIFKKGELSEKIIIVLSQSLPSLTKFLNTSYSNVT